MPPRRPGFRLQVARRAASRSTATTATQVRQGRRLLNAFKITSELSLKWDNWGAFARATYFYDFENANRDDLTEIAKEKVGKDFRMLDAFVYNDFKIGDHSGSIRLGRQAVSWGESTFIQNGINVINPIDISRLRVAGAELKEAFLPIDMVWGSFSFTDNLSMEAVYLFEFEEIEVDPSGTYFSSNDFASPGGTRDAGLRHRAAAGAERSRCSTCHRCRRFGLRQRRQRGLPRRRWRAVRGNSVPRLPNRNTRDDGQYGVAAFCRTGCTTRISRSTS